MVPLVSFRCFDGFGGSGGFGVSGFSTCRKTQELRFAGAAVPVGAIGDFEHPNQ